MPIILGAIVGRAFGLLLGRVVFSHAALTVILWYGLSATSFWLARINLGARAGPWAALLIPAALLTWTLRHPARSRVKLWLFDGFYVWARLGVAWAGAVALFRLVTDGGSIATWLPGAWPYLAAGAGCWLLQRALTSWLRRSHLRAGDLSVIEG